MRVLPNRLGDDEPRRRIDPGEDLHSFLLRTDEAVPFGWFKGMSPHQLKTQLTDGPVESVLHFLLREPATLVGGGAEVAIGNQQNLIPIDSRRLAEARQLVGSSSHRWPEIGSQRSVVGGRLATLTRSVSEEGEDRCALANASG